ncbi:hypothetical protein A4H97_16910 [Niastella yeongjuensis]|uniref:Tetratricopeptide repeat protein n=1 Tax=Niastella yeongjuensis TaxID=354355 RepID=A0A1V9E1B1_9BACT|nr:hypothetical protein [Niastella yeongjuensis]OQP39900.1 hypothetical protein A4H97_16910 [Niastella yeongjuensis]SEO09484.1 hypothetical protein SAMN05660816_02127 [Niastella yeongjuensis]
MQYHIQTLVKHLFDKDSFEQVTEQELKQFTDDYPYAAVGQFLYAKKLKDVGSYNHYEQGEQASLYFHNALWLRWQLDQKEEAPVIPVKAEEPDQQPGFRIVQLAKNGPSEHEPLAEEPATSEQPIQLVAEQTTAPAMEGSISTEEEEKSLQVNENGSLVEKEEAIAETASAVAIAEISQLAEESKTTEAAANAVSITEEALIPPAVSVEPDKDADEIVPAVEVINAELETTAPEDDIVPAVDVTKIEMEVTAVADDVVPAIEIAPEELAAIAPVTATEVATEPLAPAEIAIEEQLVEEINEIIPAAEPIAVAAEAPTQQVAGFTAATQEGKSAVDLGEPIFESYHTIDYFASQGIKLLQEELKDKLGKQLKSFTDWLRSMKRIGPIETNTSLDDVTNQSIQRIAEHSIEEKEVLTEAMAEVWVKQGNPDKAIRVYEKLSLLNPAKRPYFAGRIEQLKAQ